MLTKAEALKLVVSLARMNDLAVLSEGGLLTDEVCGGADRPSLKRVIWLVDSLRKVFDYTESPEFLAAIAGRSGAFIEMKRKLVLTPERRKEHLARLDRALESLLSSTEAFELVPQRRHGDLEEVKRLVEQLENPG